MTDAADPPRQDDCLFCRVVSGELPSTVVAENEFAVAFLDIQPVAPEHVLVVSRAHHVDVGALALADPAAMSAVMELVARVGADRCGGQHRVVFNSGARAAQAVPHVHAHVLGGRDLTWPPG